MKEILAKIGGNEIPLQLGRSASTINFDRNTCGRRCLVIARLQETQYRNLKRLQILIFHAGPPWVTLARFITDPDD